MRKKILILGSNGMAGHVIAIGLKEDKEQYEVITVARSNDFIKPTYLVDVSQFNYLQEIITIEKPDFIINCVGLLNKFAENNPDKAILMNAYLPHFLESLCKNNNIKVIHISTDCVFSGQEGGYTETSFKNGVGFYAQSKALGEIINGKDVTFRTSIIGPELNSNGIGLFHWFYNQTVILKGFSKAYWTGITTIELFNAIKFAINENITGLYHLVNNKKISKYELLKMLNIEFGKNLIIEEDSSYKIDKSLINSRNDFSFKVKSYSEMLREMRFWMQNHQAIYPHYKIL